MPKQGRDGTSDNCKTREVPPERSSSSHRKRDVQAGTDDTVEDQGHSTDQTAEDYADDRLTPERMLGDLNISV